MLIIINKCLNNNYFALINSAHFIQGTRNPSQLSTHEGLHDGSARPNDEELLIANVETESLSQSTESQLEQVITVALSAEPNESQLVQTPTQDFTSSSSETQLQQVIVEDPPSESNEQIQEPVADNNDTSQSSEDVCIICLKPHVDKILLISCHHAFCRGCINAWYDPHGPLNRQ